MEVERGGGFAQIAQLFEWLGVKSVTKELRYRQDEVPPWNDA